jgi:hypothetical protein
MTYRNLPASLNGKPSVLDTETGTTFPYHGGLYEQMLDAIITEGAACFDGDIPADLQSAADEQQFNEQLHNYIIARDRLEEPVKLTGRDAVIVEEVLVPGSTSVDGEVTPPVIENVEVSSAVEGLDHWYNPETGQYEDLEYITVEHTDESGHTTTETIRNPIVVQDEEQRAAAQAVVDATPQDVKDAAGN